MEDQKPDKYLRVKYKFKDESEFIPVTVTEEQYVNLLEIPAIEECKIVGSANEPISTQEKIQFNQKILVLCTRDSSSKYLLQ